MPQDPTRGPLIRLNRDAYEILKAHLEDAARHTEGVCVSPGRYIAKMIRTHVPDKRPKKPTPEHAATG